MREIRNKMMLAAVIPLSLAGCTSLSDMHLFAQAGDKPAQTPVMAEVDRIIAPATQAGRIDLNAGRPGDAIEKFQKALAVGEPIAPAFNGMAVAYARLGRRDLAERFFEQAIATDPANPQYQVNLRQLVGSLALATGHDCGVDPNPMKAGRLASTIPEIGDTPLETPRAGQLQRVSRSEVRIVSAPVHPAPLARKPASGPKSELVGPAVEPKGFKPVIRIALNDAKPTGDEDVAGEAAFGFKPLIRVTLPATRRDDSGTASSAVVSAPKREL